VLAEIIQGLCAAVQLANFSPVADSLNKITPLVKLFDVRLNSTDFHAPLGGIERSGRNLAYKLKPNGLAGCRQ